MSKIRVSRSPLLTAGIILYLAAAGRAWAGGPSIHWAAAGSGPCTVAAELRGQPGTDRPAGSLPVQGSPGHFLSPGFVGLYQVNVEVPAGAPAGAAVPVVVNIGAVPSNTVTIAVQ